MTDFYTTNIHFSYGGEYHEISNLCIGDGNQSYNISKLFERTRGTVFRVDKGGDLQEVKGIKDWFKYQWNRKEERAKVRTAVNAALESFNECLSKLEDEKLQEVAVKYLFSQTGEHGIGRWGKTLYNHKLLKCDNVFSKYMLPPNTVRLKFADHKFVDLTSDKFKGKELPFPVGIDLGDEISNHNMWMLLRRKKGCVYQVDSEGKLEKVKSRCHYRKHKSEIEQKVQKVVTKTLKKLDAHLKKMESTEVHQLVIQEMFCDTRPLCRMNRRVFNRGAIKEGSNLEEWLAPELKEKRNALISALIELRDASNEKDKKAGKRHAERALMDLTFAEFNFARKRGIDLERVGDGGSGGARYGRDRYGHKIVVVKPGDEGPGGINNPQWYARVKRFLSSPKACLEGNSEPLSEVDSWMWDRHFDIWSVPPTEVRYVTSRDFVNKPHKECSVQMFVEGCETLGDYVGISPRIHWLPRRFLRWYCGNRFDTGPFYAFGQREERNQELLTKLPQHSIERVALQDFGTENIDCHFENILVKVSEISGTKTVLDSVFNGESVEDLAIENFVNGFFKNKGHQALLEQLLTSETIDVETGEGGNTESKRLTLVKHDGGSSNPHQHPSWFDFFAKRYKHLFEVLPHFEKPFSTEAENLVRDKGDVFATFLIEKASRGLENIVTKEVFGQFWTHEENRTVLKQWIFEMDKEKEYGLRLDLIRSLFEASGVKEKNGPKYQFYFNYHLKRIRGNLQTRMDSFRVMNKYVTGSEEGMRALFQVKGASDFRKELIDLNDGFGELMTRWKEKAVKEGTSFIEETDSPLDRSFFLSEMGEEESI